MSRPLPDGWDSDTSPSVCGPCLPVLALPLTEAQREQVVAWVWENLAVQTSPPGRRS